MTWRENHRRERSGRPSAPTYRARGELDEEIEIAGSHLFGLAVARHIVRVPAIAQLAREDLVAQVAPTIQRYLTGTHL